jgi:hypothetical protein
LMHGLHTNSGFWMPFLLDLKGFKIILLNLDYKTFFGQKNSIIYIDEYFEKQDFWENCMAIISHSFGTIISNQIKVPDSIKRYEICPVYSTNRKNIPEYISYIRAKLPLLRNDIIGDLLVVNHYIDITIINENTNVVRYIPVNDLYFQFTLKSEKNIYFSGDHFFINEAIKKIRECLIQIEL